LATRTKNTGTTQPSFSVNEDSKEMTMRWRSPLGALLFIAAMPLALSGVFEAIGSLALLAIGIGAGSALIPGFWPRLLHGAVGGVVAGLFVLGPGLRLAMRVVAVLDPVRSPEFTIDGTLFILLGVGVISGGIFGIIGNIARSGLGIPTRASGLIPALLVMVIIALDTELRSEIVELGAGPWVNIPMFAVVALAYGATWGRVVTRLEKRSELRKVRHQPVEGASMAVPNPRGLEI
jgi:hypothetical protein